MNIGTCEQLETRLAALHEASLQLVRDLSLDDVLEHIVRIAQKQTGAHYAAIGVLDHQGEQERFIHVGKNQGDVQEMPHLIRSILDDKERPVRIANLADDPRSEGLVPDQPWPSSFLGIPILSSDQKIGQIYLTKGENAAAFNEDDERVMETLAAYASVAIENTRLYDELLQRDQALTQRFDQMSLLYNLAKVSANASDMDTLLEQTLDLVIAHFESQAGEIFLKGEDSDLLWQRMHRGESADVFKSCGRYLMGEGTVGNVAKTGEPMESTVIDPGSDFLRPSLFDAGFKHVAYVPLVVSKKIIGVMTLASRQERQYTWQQMDLLKTVGTWSGTAIENARLQYRSCRIAVQEERERIGMDLHDGIVQSIYAVGLALDYARISLDDDVKAARQKLNESIQGLNDVIKDIRAYVLDLRPRQLRGGETLSHGIQCLLDEFRANTNVKTVLATAKNGINRLARQHALTLFHVCQESLANVAKHAHAEKVEVQLWHTDDRVLLKVADNGRGFDIDQIDHVIGHGLSNMRRRVRKVGGDVEISSSLNEGTTILAWVPWKRDGTAIS